MANEFVQTIADARVDAQSLSEFVFKPAGFKVPRRLAPPIDTLQFYIDRFNATKATTDAYVATIPTIVNDAINNTAIEGGVLADTFVTVTANGAGTIPRTLRDVKSERLSVKDFGAVGDGITDDAPAFQAAIDHSINNGTKSLFVPFGRGEIYRFASPVYIVSSGFRLWGDRAPTYLGRIDSNRSDEVGYITADESVKEMFIYVNREDYDDTTKTSKLGSNQVVIENVAAKGKGSTKGQTFFQHFTNNNGPHRGAGFHGVSASDLNIVFESKSDLWSDGSKVYGAASLVFDKSCVFWKCSHVAYAHPNSRTLQMRISGIQSEQGGKYTGNIDGGITITDNMLEGQGEVINIDSAVPVFKAENNYFEAMGGDFTIRLKGAGVKSSYTRCNNFVEGINSPDFIRLQGNLIINTLAPNSLAGRFSDETAYGLVTMFPSVGDGRFYVPTKDIGTIRVLSGFFSPVNLGVPVRKVTTGRYGSETFKTPFGSTTKGLTVTGFNNVAKALKSSADIKTGDIVVVCALVQISLYNSPIFRVYGDGVELGSVSQLRIFDANSENEWKILHVVTRAPIDISTLSVKMDNTEFSKPSLPSKIREKMGDKTVEEFFNYKVASVGTYTISSSDFELVGNSAWFNSTAELRAQVQLFNPLVQELSPIGSSTSRTVTATVSVPANGWVNVLSTPVSLFGTDFSSSLSVTANVDTQGIQFHARKVTSLNITIDAFNPTGEPIDLGEIELYITGTNNHK